MSGRKAQPEAEFVLQWSRNLNQLLKRVRGAYRKPIFINGAHSIYQDHVDGFMMEGFVHANWQKDDYRPSPSDLVRQLVKARRLLQLDKPVLFQSGSRGNSTGTQAPLFTLCLSGYLLVENSKSAFNYHPKDTYAVKYRHEAAAYDLDLGPPITPLVLQTEGERAPNLLVNGDFSEGLTGWSVLSGDPVHDPEKGMDPGAASLGGNGVSGSGDLIATPPIPVAGNRKYTVALYGKADENLSTGIHSYRRLGLQIRFYNRNKQQLESRPGITFDAGRFDWLPYEIDCVAPSDAAYIRLRIGFIGDGVGQGWVDRVYLGTSVGRAQVYRRDFLNGSVWTNVGNRSATIDSEPFTHPLTLNAYSGFIHEY